MKIQRRPAPATPIEGDEDTPTVNYESEEDRKWRLRIFEDPEVYSKLEINRLLSKMKSQIQIDSITNSNSLDCVIPQNKFIKSISGSALLGFIRFLRGYYLIMVTKNQVVARLGHKKISKIEDILTIYIPKNYLPSVYETSNMNIAPKTSGIASKLTELFTTSKIQESQTKQTDFEELFHKDIMNEENRYLKLFQSVHFANNFYYSNVYDLTNSLQANLSSCDTCNVQERFVWNLHFIPPKYKKSPMITKIIQGFVRQDSVFMTGCPVNITIIARRSAKYAGTRFLKRGCSLTGDVANEVETEQIVSETRFSIFELNRMSSYVQIRGSVPIHWSQNPNKHVIGKPPIEYLKYDPFYETTAIHFSDLLTRFGGPIIVLNLMKKKEKRPSEIDLSGRLLNSIRHLLQFMPKMKDETGAKLDPLIYLNFDFALVHKKCVNFTVLDKLHPIADHLLSLTGMFQHDGLKSRTDHDRISIVNELDKKFPILQKTKQFGVIRVNCVDCLDRTNTAQFIIGRCLLGYQMYQFGILETPSAILVNSVLDKIIHNAYEELGDTIALQYGGSLLVHNIGTYRRTGKIRSQSRDFMQNLSRYYSNKFSDFEKQIAINLFLGIFRPGIQTRKEQLYSIRKNAMLGINLRNTVKLFSLTAISLGMLEWRLENDSHVSWLHSWSELGEQRSFFTKWFNSKDLHFRKSLIIETEKFFQDKYTIPEIKHEYTDLLFEITNSADSHHYMDVTYNSKSKLSINISSSKSYNENAIEKSTELMDDVLSSHGSGYGSLLDLSQATLDNDLIGLNRKCIDFDLSEEYLKDDSSSKLNSIFGKFRFRDEQGSGKKQKTILEDENNSSEDETINDFDDYLTVYPGNTALFTKTRNHEIGEIVTETSANILGNPMETSIACEDWFAIRVKRFYNFEINKKPDRIFHDYFDDSKHGMMSPKLGHVDTHVPGKTPSSNDVNIYRDYINTTGFHDKIPAKDLQLYNDHAKYMMAYRVTC